MSRSSCRLGAEPSTLSSNGTGHNNISVLRRSICEGSVFRENAAAAVGL